MKAALYARVSTSGKGQDPTMQQLEMAAFCQRRGWTITRTYTETCSGAKEAGTGDRPELDELWKAVRAGKVDVVLVYRFDRFARSVRQLVDALEEFRSRQVQFVSVHEDLDTTTPQGRLVFHIFSAIAEFERALIGERVASGIAHARERGKVLGRPRSPANPLEVVRLRTCGLSWKGISTKLGIPRTTARRLFLACTNNVAAEGLGNV